MNYSEKLKDPRWQKKRLEIFERDEWSCRKCFDDEQTLSVHHTRYVVGMEPWDYPPEMLLTLCEKCHSEEYEQMPIAMQCLEEEIKDKGFFYDDVTALAVAFNQLQMRYPGEVIASIIKYLLSPDRFNQLSEVYFESLKNKQKGE